MASFLIQVAYTPEAMAAMVATPQNRIDALKPVFKKLGGKMTLAWFAFGEYDIVGIMELPDNVSAAAFSFAVSAGGAVKAIKQRLILDQARTRQVVEIIHAGVNDTLFHRLA